jgi:deazaflavin-dependent oxidoreductase (nitroreductase family)
VAGVGQNITDGFGRAVIDALHNHVMVEDAPSNRRIQRYAEKYVSNPAMRTALRAGIAPRTFAMLETVGNKTGKRRLTPVGNGLDGDTFWLVSELGLRAGYVRNLQAEPRVRVKIGRRWREGTATVVTDDDGWARREEIDQRNGLLGRLDGKVFKASATTPVTIRIDLDPVTPS